MPKSIKKLTTPLRCPDCDKLLATPEGIKCPRCKCVHSFEESFARDLRDDQYPLVFLWARDGSQASSIIIRKEIWSNCGTRAGIPGDCSRYAVFFVYNYLDPSQAFATDVGCRVNKEPFLDFDEALKLAKEQEAKVRASGKWVEAEDVKEPVPQRSADGVYDFRSLEYISREGNVGYGDFYRTLEDYSAGAAISFPVVRSILSKVKMNTPSQLAALRELARRGKVNTSGKTSHEWQQLLQYLT